MDIFISDKNHSVLKTLIEKAINDKLSINIYNTINENVVKSYINKKIKIYKNNVNIQNDIIKFNKIIIIDFINDFNKMNKKNYIKDDVNDDINNIKKTELISINVKNEIEKPEDFNEKLKKLQSERDISNLDNTNDNDNFSYDKLESFTNNNLQFNSLEQFTTDNSNFNNLYESSKNNLEENLSDNFELNNNVVNKTVNINKNYNNITDESEIQKSVDIAQEKSIQEIIQQPNYGNLNIMKKSEKSFKIDKQDLVNTNERHIVINSRDRDWRNNIDRFKYNIDTKKKDIKIVKIPVYENSIIIPNKHFELNNNSGWIDDNGNSHEKYNNNKDYGSILFEYEKIIDTDKNINITDMENINKLFIEKVIVHKDDINLPNTFIYINIPQINNCKLLLFKEKEIDDYIYYTNNNIINVLDNRDKYTFELFNYDNTYIGSNNKDFFNILNINYENNMLNITINGDIPNHFINNHYISFNNLNTNDIKINIFCKKLCSTYHKIIGISNNSILIHYEDNEVQMFNKEISGYIFIETLQNIIFLKVE